MSSQAPTQQARRLGAVWYQSSSLGLVAVIVTSVLALVYQGTRTAVAEALERDTRQSLEQVLPAGYADNNLLEDVLQIPDASGQLVSVYRARKAGKVRAVVFAQSGYGYSGRIELIMAVDAAGVVQGVRITRHSETPGLGDKIEAAKSRWIEAFAGTSLARPEPAEWAVKKDGGVFDQFAGATITPRTVVASVRRGLEFFAAQRAQLLELQPASGGQS